MKRLLLIPLLALPLIALPCFGAEYHVATNGDNGGAGSAGDPWLTIGYASSNVTAGDTVYIGQGTYAEYITNSVSGTAGSPITFEGTRGGAGEWLTVIDPSTLASNGWVASPLANTYMLTNCAIVPREMTIDGKRVAFVSTLDDIMDPGDGWTDSVTNGTDFMEWDAAATATPQYTLVTIPWWYSVQALYAVDGTTNYLRIADGSSPNGLNIRVAADYDSDWSTAVYLPAITVSSRSNLVFRNIAISNAFAGIKLTGAGTHNVVIESNRIVNGYARIVLFSGAHSNAITRNELLGSYYGYSDPGAWQYGTTTNSAHRENLYEVAKFLMGDSLSYDHSIYLNECGNSNTIVGNTITGGLGTGITVEGDVAAPYSNTVIYANTISQMPSVGISLREGHTETTVADNLLEDSNGNLRYHNIGITNETDRVIYTYRNRLWEPAGIGYQVYFHVPSTDVAIYHPALWVYHNSISGGRYSWAVSASSDEAGGHTNLHWLNNVLSGAVEWYYGNSAFRTNAAMVGDCDYNWIYPSNVVAAWAGTHNVIGASPTWSTNSLPTFRLPAGSTARDAGIDLSVEFTTDRGTFPALPDDGTIHLGPGWDIGWDEAGGILRAGTIRAGTLRGP